MGCVIFQERTSAIIKFDKNKQIWNKREISSGDEEKKYTTWKGSLGSDFWDLLHCTRKPNRIQSWSNKEGVGTVTKPAVWDVS